MPDTIQRGFVLKIAVSLSGFVVLFTNSLETSVADTLRELEIKAHQELMGTIEDSQGPANFTTDGCSGGLSRIWRLVSDKFPEFAKAHESKPPWEVCCLTHDRAYHAAGTTEEAIQSYESRLAADEELRACVIDTGVKRSMHLMAVYNFTDMQIQQAYRQIGNSIYEAVRIGGVPCTGLSWRWGYGYPNCSLKLKFIGE